MRVPRKPAVSPMLRCELAIVPAGRAKTICVRIHEVYSKRRIVMFRGCAQDGGVNPRVAFSGVLAAMTGNRAADVACNCAARFAGRMVCTAGAVVRGGRHIVAGSGLGTGCQVQRCRL